MFIFFFCWNNSTKVAFWNCLEWLFALVIHHFSPQDTDVYKTTVKDDITKWQNVLKAHNSVDWLIVVVESDAKKKNKTNILPRTSIVDKIRNDFCNKQSDRWGIFYLQTFKPLISVCWIKTLTSLCNRSLAFCRIFSDVQHPKQ